MLFVFYLRYFHLLVGIVSIWFCVNVFCMVKTFVTGYISVTECNSVINYLLFGSFPLSYAYVCVCRGIYLSCLLYNEDRILVTNEDNLPIVEVDESFSSTNLQADFHWLMKVCVSQSQTTSSVIIYTLEPFYI